jgi:hypothetical protein
LLAAATAMRASARAWLEGPVLSESSVMKSQVAWLIRKNVSQKANRIFQNNRSFMGAS